MKPTEVLMEEHRVVERVINALEKAAIRLSRGEKVYLRFFIGTTVLINGFKNGYHHKKEERVLLTALVENGIPIETGALAEIKAEHDESRRLAQKLRQMTERLQAGDVRAREMVVVNAMDYVKLLRRHIWKEDSILFPMVDRLIPSSEQEHILKDFDRFEQEENGIDLHEKYYGMADRLVQECIR